MNRPAPGNSFRFVVCAPGVKEYNTIELCVDGYPENQEKFDYAYIGMGALLIEDAHKNALDVLFLDVAIKDIAYLDLARRLRADNPDFTLVLMVDDPEQAMKGYSLRAFRCLRKQALYEELKECLPELHYELGINRDMVSFRCSDSICHVFADEILFAESQHHTVYVHYLGRRHEPSPIYDSLADVETMLKPHGFVRIHHSFIINLDYLVDVKGFYVTLSNGHELPISRPLHAEIKALLKITRGKKGGHMLYQATE